MIKKIVQEFLGEMIYCDHCGEGMALNTDDVETLNNFKAEHENCTKIKNDNLAFLQDAELFNS